MKKQIKECEHEFRNEGDNKRRLELQSEIMSLQRTLRQKRNDIFTVEDEIMARRKALIEEIDNSLNKSAKEEYLFTMHGRLCNLNKKENKIYERALNS